MNHLKTIGILLSITLIVGIVLSVGSCTIGGNDKPDTTYSYVFRDNSAIKVDTSHSTVKNGKTVSTLHFSIQKGTHLVFIYRKMKPGPKKVRDGGGISRSLVFEIPADSQKFSYRDDKLQNIRALYRYNCLLCPGGGLAVRIKHGLIRGEKVNPVTWIISVDATMIYSGNSIHLKFREPFYEQSLLQ